MRAVIINREKKDAWNDLALQEASFSLMQSWEWGDYKEKLGWNVFRVAVEEGESLLAGAQLLVKTAPFRCVSVAYIPRGPFGNWIVEDVFKMLFDLIYSIAKSFNTIFLKVEPGFPPNKYIDILFENQQFIKSCHPIQPLTTLIMDINQDDECILRCMRKSTRRKISYAERKGVEVFSGNTEHLDVFYNLMKITARRAGFTHKSYEYYKNEWNAFKTYNWGGFFLAYFKNFPIAAHIAFKFGKHAAFFHQVSTADYGNLNANSLLVWEEIQWAKRMGCTTYDFWGIPDDVSLFELENKEVKKKKGNGLWGVYQFKTGFCKNLVRFCGSYDRVYLPGLYHLMMNDFVFHKLENHQGWLSKFVGWSEKRS